MKQLSNEQTYEVSGGLDGISISLSTLAGFTNYDYQTTINGITALGAVSGLIGGLLSTAQQTALGLTPLKCAALGLGTGTVFGFATAYYGYRLGQYLLSQYDQPQG